jgi:hypothetical protein
VLSAAHAEAGGVPDPNLLRTWPALMKTLQHLRTLMYRVGPEPAASSSSSSSGGVSLLEAHRFLWDRYRSIRKDITQTGLAGKVRHLEQHDIGTTFQHANASWFCCFWVASELLRF